MVPASVDLVALVDARVRAEDPAELLSDLEDELRREPVCAGLRREDDRRVLGVLVVLDGVLSARQRAPRLHQIEDVVPALIRSRSCRGPRGGRRRPGNRSRRARSWCIPHGVSDEVERVGDWGIAARIAASARVRSLRSLPKYAPGGSLHAVALVAVEVLVQVGGDDLLLADLTGIRLGEPDRLDDLADLALLAAAFEGRRAAGAGPGRAAG